MPWSRIRSHMKIRKSSLKKKLGISVPFIHYTFNPIPFSNYTLLNESGPFGSQISLKTKLQFILEWKFTPLPRKVHSYSSHTFDYIPFNIGPPSHTHPSSKLRSAKKLQKRAPHTLKIPSTHLIKNTKLNKKRRAFRANLHYNIQVKRTRIQQPNDG